MSSLDIMSNSSQRHLLSPKSIRRAVDTAKVQCCYSSLNTNTLGSLKRPLNDENFDPTRTYASPQKRTKSILGNSTNTFAWDDKVRLAVDEKSTGRFPLIDKKGPSSIASMANNSASATPSAKSSASDSPLAIPGTGKRSYNENFEFSKPRVSSPLKKSFRYSPPRLSPSRSRKRNFSRIDPPSSLRSSSSSSIDEILRFASSSWKFDQGYSHSSDESEGGVSLIITALGGDYSMPDSWNFAIYEDTPDETLQNLMEHSTGILDISDDSDDDLQMDEIVLKGKENIPPVRLQELLSASHNIETSTESVRPAPIINQRRTTTGMPGKIMKGNREVLGRLKVEDFYPPEEKLMSAKNFVPIAKKAAINFSTGYPATSKLDTIRNKSESQFEIWESESAKEESGDESEDGGVRLRSRAYSPIKESLKQPYHI